MNELKDFIEISKYAGTRFDLVQSGGGNSSVKNEDGTMYIKASGYSLSDVEENFGYTIVNNEEITKIFEDKNILSTYDKHELNILVSEYILKCNLTDKFRPSIETLLHLLLQKYTLHTHPIVVNAITSRNNWKEVLIELFGENIILVDYKTPGYELAVELKKQLANNNAQIIFLQNHGLIVTSDTKTDIKNLTDFVVDKTEKYLNVDMTKYKLAEDVSSFFDNEYTAYLSEDIFLNNSLSNPYIYSLPFCPDKMVYCGVKTLSLGDNPKHDIEEYKQKYFDIPKVIIYKGHLFFIAKNIRKAKEMEDVFKFHLMSLNINQNNNINYLSENEIGYIGNWEAEKYRQKV